MRPLVAIAALWLAACSGPAPDAPPVAANAGATLESAAIATGVIPDPADADATGLYTQDTDSVCVVPSATAYRIGVVVDYDMGQGCTGSGTADRDGGTLHVTLDGTAACKFDARFEGDRIVFPANLPDACHNLCHGRASLAALDVSQLSDSIAEASTLRDPRGRLLCGDRR